jgi:hypothetical protein
MTTDCLQSRPSTAFDSPYFLLDTELNVVGVEPYEHWPAAVLTALQACVRRALADGRSTFIPCGIGPRWTIVPVCYEDHAGFGVFPEPWN